MAVKKVLKKIKSVASKAAPSKEGGVLAASDDIIVKFEGGKLKLYVVKLVLGKWKGWLALPGSQLGMNEDLDAAAERVYKEATGQKNILHKEQLYTFSDPKRDSRQRCISTAFIVVPEKIEDKAKPSNKDKYAEGQWIDFNKAKDLAFDNMDMLKRAKSRIAAKLEYSNLGVLMLPTEFTLSELQKLYEFCWNKKIDKRNFRKKILAMKIVKETGKMRQAAISRPAMLYKAFSQKLQYLSLF